MAHLTVHACGAAVPWRLRDGDACLGWIEAAAWAEQAAWRSARTSAAATPAVVREVTRRVRASGIGVDPVELEPEVLRERGLLAAIASWTQTTTTDPRGLVRVLASETTPRMFVAVAPPSRLPGLEREAATLTDLAAKSASPTAFGVLLLGENGAGGDRLDVGAPVAEGVGRTPPWPAYLHERLGWEAGGHLELVLHAEVRLARVRTGDDDGVELVLNELARSRWAELPGPAQTAVHAYIRAETAGHAATTLPDDCLHHGESVSRLAPWAARAVLLETPDGPSRPLLRSRLICAPLAARILARCFHLEARVRAQLTHAAPPSPDAEAMLADRYQRTEHTKFYPRDCPALPRSAWDVASLGDALAAAPPSARRSAGHRLRELRNRLAHGHYAGWACVRELADLEAAL